MIDTDEVGTVHDRLWCVTFTDPLSVGAAGLAGGTTVAVKYSVAVALALSVTVYVTL